jgi:hypothetical protein
MRSRVIPFDRLARLVADHSDEVDAAALSQPREASVLFLPAWVHEHGLASSAGILWLWAVPAGDEDTVALGQASLDVPAGRYVIDGFDTVTRTWISRESAAAPPLVIGLPRRGGPVLLRLARLPECPP